MAALVPYPAPDPDEGENTEIHQIQPQVTNPTNPTTDPQPPKPDLLPDGRFPSQRPGNREISPSFTERNSFNGGRGEPTSAAGAKSEAASKVQATKMSQDNEILSDLSKEILHLLQCGKSTESAERRAAMTVNSSHHSTQEPARAGLGATARKSIGGEPSSTRNQIHGKQPEHSGHIDGTKKSNTQVNHEHGFFYRW